MAGTQNDNDPMNFVRNLWGNVGFNLPGMVTPTMDTDELAKQISDLKAVEGWLRMNLSMLQMTIQNLEMQRTTLTTVQALGRVAQDANESGATSDAAASLSQAAMWPWAMMQQVQEQVAKQAEEAEKSATAAAVKSAGGEKAAKRSKKD
ncbi:MAG TPA: PhaM family polyhydroxyalkanoate granule multifunctional regulatory protein [Rhodocyclaceae bacterium]